VQVDVLPVTDRQNDYARDVVARLKTEGWRAEGDFRNEKLGYKIRESQMQKVPYALVIGEREALQGQVAPRKRGGEQIPPVSLEEFIRILKGESETTPT
jgi:threonyl-tRNA synthetase